MFIQADGTISSYPSSSSTPLMSPLVSQLAQLPDVDSLPLNNLQIDPMLLEMDSLLHMDSLLPQADLDVMPSLNSEDSVSLPSSSHTLARTTPVPISKGPVAWQSSHTPGSKVQKDFITTSMKPHTLTKSKPGRQHSTTMHSRWPSLRLRKRKCAESMKLRPSNFIQLAQIQSQQQLQHKIQYSASKRASCTCWCFCCASVSSGSGGSCHEPCTATVHGHPTF